MKKSAVFPCEKLPQGETVPKPSKFTIRKRVVKFGVKLGIVKSKLKVNPDP